MSKTSTYRIDVVCASTANYLGDVDFDDFSALPLHGDKVYLPGQSTPLELRYHDGGDDDGIGR